MVSLSSPYGTIDLDLKAVPRRVRADTARRIRDYIHALGRLEGVPLPVAHLAPIGTPRKSAPSAGTSRSQFRFRGNDRRWESAMHGIVYLVGLVVIVLAILSFFGLR